MATLAVWPPLAEVFRLEADHLEKQRARLAQILIRGDLSTTAGRRIVGKPELPRQPLSGRLMVPALFAHDQVQATAACATFVIAPGAPCARRRSSQTGNRAIRTATRSSWKASGSAPRATALRPRRYGWHNRSKRAPPSDRRSSGGGRPRRAFRSGCFREWSRVASRSAGRHTPSRGFLPHMGLPNHR